MQITKDLSYYATHKWRLVKKKKPPAFDIRHDFKQKSKPFDVYDDVLVLYIHRNR